MSRLLRPHHAKSRVAHCCITRSLSSHQQPKALKTPAEVEAFLSRPAWSVRSLLPSKAEAARPATGITSERLHHLLRLSALPRPRDHDEEAHMLSTLASQLHFVRAVQGTDTEDVQPLRSLRDENVSDAEEQTFDLRRMKDALSQEEHVGNFYRRIRRRRDQEPAAASADAEAWDVLKHAERKVGGFFVVEGAPRDE